MSAANRHSADSKRVHHAWDPDLEPTLVIGGGDVVDFELPVTGDGQVDEGSSASEVVWDFDTIYNLVGPVYVEGAAPGDTLEVEVLALTPGPWGWTATIPGMGLLPEEFPDPYLKIFDLRERETAALAPGVEIPLNPFIGTMGILTDETGTHSPFPPNQGGGNMDNRHLTVGSSLLLPVWRKGAMFSCGDAHAAQGDGEVCVTGIECPMQATLRFKVHQRSIPGPSYSIAARTGADDIARAGFHGTMGISPDLYEGAQIAVRNMIQWLVEDHDLSREDAYVLCSLAGDLKIHEIVDAGVWNVGMTMPLAVFV